MSALFSALTPASPGDGSTGGVAWGLGMVLGGNLSLLSGSGGLTAAPRPLYYYTLPLYGTISLILYLLGTRLVQPIGRWRLRWKDLLPVLVLVLALAGIVALVFALTAGRYGEASTLTPPSPTLPAVNSLSIERQMVQGVAEVACRGGHG
jgi:hypothetical protein